MLRSQFEEDLEKLHNQFYAMGQEVLSQINRTVRAFVTHDRDLAKEVIEDDAEVNEYEVKLEKKSFEMIALQQPVSQDLRTVLTVLKAVSDVERMGDHAVAIAQATIRMKGEERIPAVEEEIKKWDVKLKALWKQHLIFILMVLLTTHTGWPPWMSKLTTILKLSVTLRLKRLRKIQKPLLRVVIISKLFPTWSVSVTMLKISVNGLSTLKQVRLSNYKIV